MNTLIKITEQTIDQETVQAVNARELHTFLEVKSEFRNWIKNRIEEYGFLENKDFISFAKILAKPKGGRPSTEYHITLDMAKELSMVERNEKSRQARRYFIECEKKLKSQSTNYDNDTRFDNFNYLRQYVLTNYPKIMGIIFSRLLKIDEIEKELDHYKSVTKEAKRVLARSVVKAA
ncbi:antA/AntB antirepressor family protein [Bartonella vinsonii]|uniref:Phage anti-repressor protein n=1 Tax=Bartonella vinsonii TaxID=33047 RepID=A0A3S4YG52_BARVI|nr:antA/AntB antirepressor family protein [Bartonella vinsonii]VEJ44932.1 Phage anti-repressor protein [Bartonella vinsonii]